MINKKGTMRTRVLVEDQGREAGQKGAPGGCCAGGLSRDLNPGPLAPEARIIPLDH